MLKKSKIILSIASVLFAGSLMTNAFAGTTGEPGSVDDPIITKSYVDEQISLLKQSLTGDITTQPTSPGTVVPIIVVELTAGDRLIGKAGTEIIVRSGKVVASGDGSNGIPNVTAGVDIRIGNTIPLNHQLIIPRDDGRGFKAQDKVFALIRGDYKITK